MTNKPDWNHDDACAPENYPEWKRKRDASPSYHIGVAISKYRKIYPNVDRNLGYGVLIGMVISNLFGLGN